MTGPVELPEAQRPMSLYLLTTEHYDYDEHMGFVIAHRSYGAARALAARRADSSQRHVWLDKSLSTCTAVSPTSKYLAPRVLLGSIRYG